mgnify:FL=1
MTDVFLRIVELSWQAGVLALAVMLARLALRRAPKWAVCLLWVLVAVRLVLPFSLQSPVSLQAAQSPVTAALYELPQTQEAAQKTDEVLSGGSVEPVTPLPPAEIVTAQPVPASKPVMTVSLLAAVWLAGVVMMLTYMLVSYLGIYRRVCTAVRLEDNVYRCGSWGTPFVLGLLRPRIYVPEGMDDAALPQVLAHERCHIRRGDHLVKPLAFLLLALHWFNPVLWAAYVLLGRDMENACDERVLRGMDGAGRAAYSRALVACAVRQRPAAVCPLAFGEVAVQERVKNAMNGKKPAVWAAVLLVIAAAVIAVCFLTSPGRRGPSADGAWDAKTLYDLRTPYVGDPSAVGRILNAVGLDKMGADSDWDFTMQLSTEQEPYGLTLLYTYDSESFLGYGPTWAQRMRAGGYLTMALIDNLAWVAWQENGTEMGRVTNDGAYDIAAARQSVDGLRQLIEQLEADIAGGAVGGTRQVYYSPAAVTREDGISARLADVAYQGGQLTGELWVIVPPEMTAQYEGEDGAAAMLQEFGLITQVDDGETQRTGGDVRVESGADGLTLYQPFDLDIQLSAEQGFTVRFWAGDMGPMTVEYTAAGAASKEITPWPSEMENDPVSIDPADYGIVYDAAHLPDWETCPLSYLCAYLLGSDGAYTEGAADTLAARCRQAPRTVQNYLDKLAAKYEGTAQRLLARIQLASDEGAPSGTSLIGALYNEAFDYTDGGSSGHYTYRVPQLLADTKDAKAINREIADRYGPIVEEALASKEGGMGISCRYVAWTSYQYGDILSLIVSCGWNYDATEESVYLYDTAAGTRLTTTALLTALGVDETVFLDTVRRVAAERFDAKYSQTGAAAEEVAERRAWTLSDANINMDIGVYPDGAGWLYAVVPIGSIAGASAYEQVLPLGLRG